MRSSLTSTALLGTRRAADFPAPQHESLTALWEILEEEASPERALLRAAMLEQAAWHAGQRTLEGAKHPKACALDTRPYAPAAAASALQQMIHGEFAHLTGEWIAMAQLGGFAAPPRLIPELLNVGQRHADLRSVLAEIVGERGRWLAKEVDAWPWIHGECSDTSTPLQEDWLTGTLTERTSWLSTMLRQDPLASARAVAESWKGDSPEAREQFAMATSLQPDAAHIDWLEQLALRDRRKATRESAIRALMKLPDSGFYKRSLERAAALLAIKRKTLCLKLPKQFETAWAKDGYQEKGNKASWVLQLLATLPLSLWPRVAGHATPFQLKLDPDWSDTLCKAIAASAVLHRDVDGLVSALETVSHWPAADRPRWLLEILTVAPPERRADLIEPLLLERPEHLLLLRRLMPPLDQKRHPKLHQAATDWLTDAQASINKADAVALAGICDPRAIPSALKKLAKLDSLTAAGEQYARALEFRQSYLSHLLSTS